MNNPQTQRPSILRANQPQSEKQMKRASFSEEVMNAEQMRRASGLSIPVSENTTDDSNKSNETFDFWPKTSSFPLNNKPRSGRLASARSDSTVSSKSTQAARLPFNEKNISHMKRVLDSTFWTALIICLSLVLVFGGSFHSFFPKATDPYFNILFIITIAILSVDIMMMCYVTPMYFVFKPSMKLKKGSDETGCLCFSFEFGSFKFWFDVISTLSLLFEISYIVPDVVQHEHIAVNEMGIPQNIGEIHSLSANVSILVVVLSTARVARLLLRMDFVTKLQSWTASFGKRLRTRRRNKHDHKISFGRKFFKDQSSLGEERLEEMNEAATKIQRAWRNQNTLDVIRAFQLSGASFANKNPNKKLSHAAKGDDDGQSSAANQKVNSRKKLILRSTKQRSKRSKEDSNNLRKDKRKKKKSQIGSAMNEMTMRRVAVGMMIAIILATIFTYSEPNLSRELTTVSMHNTMAALYNKNNSIVEDPQPELLDFLRLQIKSSTPDMYNYTFHTENGNIALTFMTEDDLEGVRNAELLKVIVCNEDKHDENHLCTLGSTAIFVRKNLARYLSCVSLIFIIFLLIMWIVGLLLFVGPVTTLVVYPIERMIRLLSMLVKDPLGYSRTKKYRQFVKEDDDFAYNTTWTPESLNGMETSFLMSTILRIGEYFTFFLYNHGFLKSLINKHDFT